MTTDTGSLPRRQYTSIAIAVLLCLGLTIAAFHQVRSWETETLEAEFAHRVNNHVAVLQETIDRDVELIESVAGLYVASQNVERSEFGAFVQPYLHNHPEIQAFGWIPRVTHDDRSVYEQAARRDGLQDFQLTEQAGPGHMAKASARAEYFPVYYLEPLKGNEQGLGFNLATEPLRRHMLETARDLGTASTSSWIRLVQEPDDQYGVLVSRPIYARGEPVDTVTQRRASLVGYVNGVFRVGNLIERSLMDLPAAGLDIWVYEGDSPELATTSYFHPSRTRQGEKQSARVPAKKGHAGLHKHVVLTLPERQWSFLFTPAPAFYAAHGGHYATGVLIVGLLLTVLLGVYLTSMVRSSRRTATFAARQARLNTELEREIEVRNHAEQALSTSEQKYRALVDHAPEAITVLDLESGCLVEVNQHAEQLFGMERDVLQKTGPIALSPPIQPDGRASDQAAYEYIQQAVDGDTPTFEWTHQNATGQEIPCEVRLSRLPDPDRILVRGTITDISARKQSEGLQKRLGRILDNSSNEIYIFDAETLYFTQVNKGARDNLGYSMQEFAALTPVDIKPHFTEQQFRERLASLRSSNQDLLTFITEHERKDGTLYPVEVRLHLSREENPQVFVAIIQDITKRKQAEQALRASEQYNRMLFEESIIGLVLCRMNGDHVDVNPAFASMIGRTVEDTLQLSYWDITPGKYGAEEQGQLESIERTGRYGPYEKEYFHADGHLVPVRLSGQILERDGEKFIWSSVEDITDYTIAHERINHMAFHDGLTDLPNRELLRDRLGHAINVAQRYNNSVGIMFLDLDRFKTINDTLGHSVGDQLLQLVAGRLSEIVRESDTVARFGGDEFVVIAEQLTDREQLSDLASKIITCMQEPFHLDAHELFVTTSIGLALYPESGMDVDALIAQADIAMYQVKESGRNNYQYYSKDVAERVIQRTNMENDLRGALERNELLFHCQPIVGLENEQTLGMEALMRWQHPERGLVNPAEFIPVMEESGMILPATRWILGQACRQCRKITQDTHIDLSVAVNFSAHCFRDEDIAEHVHRTLKDTGIEPRQLIIEITESTLFQETRRVRSVLENLRAIGVRIALDDFGTGQSSLSHLRNFPIDIVKVDRDFIRDIPEDRNDCELVAAIIAMAHNLNMRVVAEGVETGAQLDFLRQHNCDAVQGYFFSPPLPADELHASLTAGSRLLKSSSS
ncbi:MAG: EAL domain-containing protein [Gammaproteobacteria bacterium]